MVQQLAGDQGRVRWALGARNGSQQLTLVGVSRQSEALSVVEGALAMLAMRLNSVTGGVQMGEVSEEKNGQP